ncbi:MAG: hypothetical protein KIT84_30535 [Labilithrix sp.]|nr:hypothetical protein [Labilithrix sp.]MCW5815404.1 hypothetical protein [Labilithrix sp.]
MSFLAGLFSAIALAFGYTALVSRSRAGVPAAAPPPVAPVRLSQPSAGYPSYTRILVLR